MTKYIAHIDMDAFFAAVEQRDNPLYRGRPVIVGADPKGGRGRGVVSTCSYEARKFGVHSAMPISKAYQKCPQAVYLPVDMGKYHAVSGQLYKIFDKFTPSLEPVSIDEAFLDISDTYKLFGPSTSLRTDGEHGRTIGAVPLDACKALKDEILKSLRLTASVGLAPTKMAAKIASDLKKPDGLVEVSRDNLLDFLWPLDAGKIPGLGPKGKELLEQEGINTIGEIAKCDVQKLIYLFGKYGASLWELANGKDERRVEVESETKSLSSETTFAQDSSDEAIIKAALLELCEHLSFRLRHNNFKGRSITLKVRLSDFSTYTRAITLSTSVNLTEVIYKYAGQLYDNFKYKKQKVRLIGVKVSGLLPADYRDNLFPDKSDSKRQEAHKAVDKLRQRFGDNAIYRAGIHP